MTASAGLAGAELESSWCSAVGGGFYSRHNNSLNALTSFSLLMLPGGIFCLALGPGASYNPRSLPHTVGFPALSEVFIDTKWLFAQLESGPSYSSKYDDGDSQGFCCS